MVLFLHPLFQEDYQEQGSHDKADSFRIERKHSSQDAVQSSVCDPVKIVEERNPEIEPAFIDIMGNGRRIIQSKGFIAEHKDQKRLFPAGASVLLHESNAVKKMAGLDGEGNEQSLQRSKGDSSMVTATNSRGTAEDDHGHDHGVYRGKSQRMHVKTIDKGDKPETGKYGNGIREGFLESP